MAKKTDEILKLLREMPAKNRPKALEKIRLNFCFDCGGMIPESLPGKHGCMKKWEVEMIDQWLADEEKPN